MEFIVGVILGLVIGLLFWYNEHYNHSVTKKKLSRCENIKNQYKKALLKK